MPTFLRPPLASDRLTLTAINVGCGFEVKYCFYYESREGKEARMELTMPPKLCFAEEQLHAASSRYVFHAALCTTDEVAF